MVPVGPAAYPSAMRLLLRTLLRLLLPAWGFFDVVGVVPVLEWRPMAPDGRWGLWRPVLHAPAWRWWHAVWHPEGTRLLALQTVVERATFACLQRDEDATESLTLVAHLVEQVATSTAPQRLTYGWAWRLVAQHTDRMQVVHERQHPGHPR